MKYYDTEINISAPIRPAEWKVYFEGGYGRGRGRKHAGREICLDRQFAWEHEIWHVPAFYSCGSGMVMDFCVEIGTERLRDFLNRWAFLGWDEENVTREQREQIEQDNPLHVDFCPVLYLNGRKMNRSFGSGLSWIPEDFLPEGIKNPPEASPILEHYGLDAAQAWSFHRWSFPWITKRRPVIRSLRLRLEREAVSAEGVHFEDPSVGDAVVFKHPIYGRGHRLTVREYERQKLPENALGSGKHDYPKYYTAMTYTLEPDLPESAFRVRDCAENDPFCTGGIGGADGPVAVILSAKKKENCHNAVSALRFEPTENVEWKMIFREKRMQDREVDLLAGA